MAYAIAGSVLVDLTRDPLGTGDDGKAVFLRDLWPTDDEVAAVVSRHLKRSQFVARYGSCEEGEANWNSLATPEGATFGWNPQSSMLRRPPYFERSWLERNPRGDFKGARILAILGDSVTTDHIAPLSGISRNVPADHYLKSLGIPFHEYGTYLLRRSNHEVLIRGAFANIRLRNKVCAPLEGGLTKHFPSGEVLSMYDAANRYIAARVPTVVIAGKEYGSGSSRDWAAKGPAALVVRAVIAESFERIHRSNLVGMGIVPLEFPQGVNAETLRLDGTEEIDVTGLAPDMTPRSAILCTIRRANGASETIALRSRLDTRREIAWYQAGGILNYVFEQIRKAPAGTV